MSVVYTPRAHSDHPPFLYSDYKGTRTRSPAMPLIPLVQTLSEVTGPGPLWSELSEEDADLTTNAGTGAEAIGQRSIITGRVLDENGAPIPDALIEIWQANSCGRYGSRPIPSAWCLRSATWSTAAIRNTPES